LMDSPHFTGWIPRRFIAPRGKLCIILTRNPCQGFIINTRQEFNLNFKTNFVTSLISCTIIIQVYPEGFCRKVAVIVTSDIQLHEKTLSQQFKT
jgi:hypothetical protein